MTRRGIFAPAVSISVLYGNFLLINTQDERKAKERGQMEAGMKPISKNQYDLYVFFTRSNLAEFFNEEIEWYINEAKTLWAVICLDRQDKDYTVIFSARDENRQIRCIDVKIDIVDIDQARKLLFSHAKVLESESLKVKDQTVNKKVVEDLFIPKVKESKLSPNFKLISESPFHSAARNVINEIMPHFFDVDGNFVEQFQTTGFDARLWELYLFCYFNEEGLQIDHKHSAPDFLLTFGEQVVSVEAVTVGDINPDRTYTKLPEPEEIMNEKEFMPARWGSSLYSKLTRVDKSKRHYWEYEYTEGKPFVIAVADFHEIFSMTWSQNSLITYLYGYEYEYYHNTKGELIIHPKKIKEHSKGEGRNTIPSGFFFQENTENVSAVLSSSCATISKFSRIGKQCGFDENNILMYRVVSFDNPDPNAAMPNVIQYTVTEENSEPWSEGVTVFHNPNAKYPLPLDFFPNAAQCYLREDNMLVTVSRNPVVYSSVSLHFASDSAGDDLAAFRGLSL